MEPGAWCVELGRYPCVLVSFSWNSYPVICFYIGHRYEWLPLWQIGDLSRWTSLFPYDHSDRLRDPDDNKLDKFKKIDGTVSQQVVVKCQKK